MSEIKKMDPRVRTMHRNGVTTYYAYVGGHLDEHYVESTDYEEVASQLEPLPQEPVEEKPKQTKKQTSKTSKKEEK